MTELYDIQDSEAVSVSRKQAKTYEELDLWYANEDGLFTDLGKFLGNNIPLPGRVSDQLQRNGHNPLVRSSVENLRNPVHRVVEFYASTLLAGDLEEALSITTENADEDSEQDSLKQAIRQVWEWSNLSQTKQVLKRYTAKYGQTFIKVVKPSDKDFCYLQIIRPQHVTSFEEDERGNVTYARLDVPDVENAGTPYERHVWHSEVWSKDDREAIFATTERKNSDTVPAQKKLKEAGKTVSFSDIHGADFVPVVVVNAADTGEHRPAPVYAHGLHLVAWINREATRLSDLLFRFNKAFKGIVGIGNDAQNRPLPAPKPDGIKDLGAVQAEQQAMQHGQLTQMQGGSRGAVLSREHDDISIDGVAVIGLPGEAQMVDLAPNIDYASARAWIQDHVKELYEECPELLYYAVESRANQSGEALRTLLAGAIHRAEEMRANILSALLKADKMALTVAQNTGLEGFSAAEISTYDGGGFEHSFDTPEIFPTTDQEKEAARKEKIQNVSGMLNLLQQHGVSAEKRREILLSELGLEEVVGDDVENIGEAEDADPTDADAARAALDRRLAAGATPRDGGANSPRSGDTPSAGSRKGAGNSSSGANPPQAQR